MTTHPSPTIGASQCDKILACLEAVPGQWCPMPTLVEVSGAYAIATRISELRKRGHVIEHKPEREGTKLHSFYRLIKPQVKEEL